jgi:glycosyltransferase involved in cell wall biosynthesis
MKLLMLASGSYKSTLTFRIVCLGQQLARTGWDVSLIAPSADKYNNFRPDKHASLDPIRLIQPWQLTTKSASLNLLPYICTSILAIFRVRAQVIYLYKPTPITIAGLLPKLLFRTPVILDLDDLGSEVMKAQGQSALQVLLVALCERLALRFASAVVVTSTHLESVVSNRYPKKTILVLPNGVDPAEYPLAKVQAPRHALYYFGALNRLELIEDLLRSLPNVLAAVPDTKVTILGGGSALAPAKKLAAQLGISRAVTFTGWIDMFAVRDYVQFADIAICYQPNTPPTRAASNMKVFQYMAMSSVLVVSDVGDLKSYVSATASEPAAGIAVAAADKARLAVALVDLLKHDERRIHMAEQARRRAETVYAWSTLGARLGRFIEVIAMQKGRLNG